MTKLVGSLGLAARRLWRTPAGGSCSRWLAGARAATTTVVRGPDTPIPGRHPDVFPPGYPRNPTPQDPGNPGPDLYPPDQGIPRRDPGDMPQRFPSPDVYPLPDNPDMPEPPLPGKGPFMARRYAPFMMVAGGVGGGGGGGSAAAVLVRSPQAVLARCLHAAAAAPTAENHPGSNLSAEERDAANKTSAAQEGAPRPKDEGDDVPLAATAAQQGGLQPEETGHSNDVPEAAGGAPRMDGGRKVGPKASTGQPAEVPTQVPKPGFPDSQH